MDFEGERKMKIATPFGIVDTSLTPLDSLKYCMGQINCGVIVLEPNTGEVLAWLGGKDYELSKYDQVKATGKQIGSLIKALNYLSAIDKGADPCAAFNDGTNMPLMDFMCFNSGATITPAHIYADTTLVKEYLLKLNLLDSNLEIQNSLGLLYGINNTSLLKTTAAFNVFNNGGKLLSPSLISTIYKSDTLLFESITSQKAVFTEEQANSVHAYLKNVLNRGSGMRLRSSNYYYIKTPIAGIEGSNQESKDNWYMGFTPDFTIGVWAGSNIAKVAFRDFAAGSGTRQAMPIFGEIVNSINADSTLTKTDDWFEYNNKTVYCK